MNAEFFNLSLGLQVALGSGYLAYMIAYAGLRTHHKTMDAVFISLAFSSLGLIAFQALEKCGSVKSAFITFLVCVVTAVIWRSFGRSVWLWIMNVLSVHREDGVYSPWDSIVQTDCRVGQVSVHLKNGGILYLDDRRQFTDVPWKGLYLGSDGGIIMVVESEKTPEGKEEVRKGIVDTDWGTRLTYIPAQEIERVNIRMK